MRDPCIGSIGEKAFRPFRVAGPRWPIVPGMIGKSLAATFAGLFLCGCQLLDSSRSRPERDTTAAADHGYALLFDLLGDEKDVSKPLIIKRERAEFRNLIKEIAHLCAAGHQQLETLAITDAGLNLKDLGLPPTEVRTRKSIGKARGKEVLTDKSKDFELHMLLYQNEALTYGSHLAAATAEGEKNSQRANFLHQLSTDLDRLQKKVVAMLLENYSWSLSK